MASTRYARPVVVARSAMSARLFRRHSSDSGHHFLSGEPSTPTRTSIFQTLSVVARAHKLATDREIAGIAEDVWERCRYEATTQFLPSSVSRTFGLALLAHASYTEALASLLAQKLHAEVAGPSGDAVEAASLRSLILQVLGTPTMQRTLIADLAFAISTDPAIELVLQPALLHKGPLAIATYRCARPKLVA